MINPIQAMEHANEIYVGQIVESRDFLEERLNLKDTKLAITLGSGLGRLAEDSDENFHIIDRIKYEDIPHFPKSISPDHKGEFLLAEMEGTKLIMMSGRSHFYDYASVPGWNDVDVLRYVTLPVRVLKAIGVEDLILTNAAGGIKKNRLFNLFNPIEVGDIMICTSYSDLTDKRATQGMNIPQLGERFYGLGFDECNVDLKKLVEEASVYTEIKLIEGNYLQKVGPNYETKADVYLARRLGFRAVGMSTFPEIIVALHGYENEEEYNRVRQISEEIGLNYNGCDYKMARKLNVIGISCITNVIEINNLNQTTEKEVIEHGKSSADQFVPLIKKTVELYKKLT